MLPLVQYIKIMRIWIRFQDFANADFFQNLPRFENLQTKV